MSVGHPRHFLPTEDHVRELARIRSQPWFIRGKKIPKLLDRAHDVPWLGGSSTDLRRVYVDPRFRGAAKYLNVLLPVAHLVPAVVEHEETEGILLVFGTDEKGRHYHYDGAHEIATAAELLRAARIFAKLRLRFDPRSYQDIFKPFLKITSTPPWPNIPTDLNLEPYRDDASGLYRDIEKAILQAQVRQSHDGKISHSEADYSPGKPHAHCGICSHYQDHHCEIVADPIDPRMWCKYFEAIK